MKIGTELPQKIKTRILHFNNYRFIIFFLVAAVYFFV